ncbi:hypothetical protein E5676_scaffold178G00420 [Cucumis melo var. makuwa]|nr:hypothetical protein E5676_scaffold178G00420 [Cucumis melo var. makuwa]
MRPSYIGSVGRSARESTVSARSWSSVNSLIFIFFVPEPSSLPVRSSPSPSSATNSQPPASPPNPSLDLEQAVDSSVSDRVRCEPSLHFHHASPSIAVARSRNLAVRELSGDSPLLLGWIRVDVEVNKDFSDSSGKGFLTTGPSTKTGNVVTHMGIIR